MRRECYAETLRTVHLHRTLAKITTCLSSHCQTSYAGAPIYAHFLATVAKNKNHAMQAPQMCYAEALRDASLHSTFAQHRSSLP